MSVTADAVASPAFSWAAPEAVSIEQGYFVFTLMPSLYCSLNCPHCYLSKAQRRDPAVLSPAAVERACERVDAFYARRRIRRKTIICYWYGGEPTETGDGEGYFLEVVDRINAVFSPAKGYDTRHVVLSSLVTVDPVWYHHFHRHCGGYLQSSYDGLMRGRGYLRRWERKVREAREAGLELGTISVVNRELLEQGPAETLDYLAELGVREASFLPFMWNEQNDGEKYERYAPSMTDYSEFMIRLSGRYLERRRQGLPVPEIGQLRFILEQARRGAFANVAGQTLFLLPNGDFVLPDYRNGWQEFMRPFGNILRQDFQDVLKSPARRAYLRRQVTRNDNPECNACEHADKCLMEFWKPNRPGDDCFGAKRYVEWVVGNAELRRMLAGASAVLF